MTVVDWVLIVVWLGLALGGFWKGAVRIIFGGGGLVAGVWLAVVAGADAQAALEGVLGIPWLAAVPRWSQLAAVAGPVVIDPQFQGFEQGRFAVKPPAHDQGHPLGDAESQDAARVGKLHFHA